jgi:hypothetical protein
MALRPDDAVDSVAEPFRPRTGIVAVAVAVAVTRRRRGRRRRGHRHRGGVQQMRTSRQQQNPCSAPCSFPTFLMTETTPCRITSPH